MSSGIYKRKLKPKIPFVCPMYGRLYTQDGHRRVRRIKGKASEYKCVGDGTNTCDRQAREWSNKDHLYSLNPNDYQPRCYSCHKKYDIILRKNKKQQILLNTLQNILDIKLCLFKVNRSKQGN